MYRCCSEKLNSKYNDINISYSHKNAHWRFFHCNDGILVSKKGLIYDKREL